MVSYYASLNNVASGPHSRDGMEEMILDGRLTPETLVVVEGGDNWQPARELFSFSPEDPVSAAAPAVNAPARTLPRAVADPYAAPAAPLLEDPPVAELNFPLVFNGRVIPGTEGLTAGQVVELCRRGGRFVIWQYAISVVVLSFRRNSGVRFLRPGKDGAFDCLKFSAISGVVGWWGIPWGIFWTLQSLIRNVSGGQDVTEPLLKDLVGPREADAIVRQKRSSFSFRVLAAGLLALAMPVALIYMIGSSKPGRSGSSSYRSGNNRPDSGHGR